MQRLKGNHYTATQIDRLKDKDANFAPLKARVRCSTLAWPLVEGVAASQSG